MTTVSFKIPVRDIQSFEDAAKTLDIDFITETYNQGDEWVHVHAIVVNTTSLVGLAFIAGINSMSKEFQKPFNDLVDKFLKPDKK